MTDIEILANFVSQFNRPFSAESACSLTGLAAKNIAPMLKELTITKQIKRISDSDGGIYVRVNRYNPIHGTNTSEWALNVTAAYELMEILENGKYTGIRPIAQVIGKSRQWVYVYLEALASIEAIDLRKHIYVVINKDKAPKIGTKVRKGILRQLRSLNRMGGHRDLS
jgi:hypothetical protein